MQWQLEEWGYRAQTAGDGAECLELAQRHCPDVVLMDLNMPVMNGFEATRRLRASPETAQIHIVAISGYLKDNQEWVDRAVTAGCNTCFGKPTDMPLLHAELSRVRAARRPRDGADDGKPAGSDSINPPVMAVTSTCEDLVTQAPASPASNASVATWWLKVAAANQMIRAAAVDLPATPFAPEPAAA
jgi:CheY-like chemotaxis protein